MPIRAAWSEDLRRLESEISDQAIRLTDSVRDVPVVLEVVAARLNAHIDVGQGASDPAHHGSVERCGHGYRIRVPGRAEAGLSPRQRFTVAHELAHVMFLEAGLLPPSGQREYWRLEDSCNRVAGKLLIPRWLAPHRELGPRDAANWVTAMQVKAQVSLAAAAKEVVLSAPNGVGTFGLVERRPGTLLVSWSLSREGKDKIPAARSHLDEAHPFGALYAQARGSRSGVVGQLESDPALQFCATAHGRTVSVCVVRRHEPLGQLSLLETGS